MKHRRRKQLTMSQSLPGDDWALEPKVDLYRRDDQGRVHFITRYHLLSFFSYDSVARLYGGGEYLYVVSRCGRIVRRGAVAIEGDPIR
jgi:hypothetical protein